MSVYIIRITLYTEVEERNTLFKIVNNFINYLSILIEHCILKSLMIEVQYGRFPATFSHLDDAGQPFLWISNTGSVIILVK